MKHFVDVLPIAALLAGCAVQAGSMDRVQAGMDREQVQAIMGQPDTVAHAPGQQCSYYTLLKDFWSRVPWSMSDVYFVCYEENKVVSFGKVDSAVAG